MTAELLLIALLLDASVAEIPVGARCLLEAYPEQLCGATATAIRWCDGTEMAWAELAPQMAQRYPAGRDYPAPPPVGFDPGRGRFEPFFRKMYGNDAAAVRARLAPVRWRDGPRTLKVTRTNGVDRHLRDVSDELGELPPSIRRFAETSGGTFNWRTIKGTDRLSMHSFAIAIDVGVEHSDYWRWARPNPDGTLRYRNRLPLEVVSIFERHGFIWGGKWHHFDTMHFEYRPELLRPACVAPSPATGELPRRAAP